MERKKICGGCVSWEAGDYWGTGSGKHGVLVEAPGFCMYKKDKNGNVVKRKRWNYCTACPNFAKNKMNGFIYQGGGDHTIQEDLENVCELMREIAEDNQQLPPERTEMGQKSIQKEKMANSPSQKLKCLKNKNI